MELSHETFSRDHVIQHVPRALQHFWAAVGTWRWSRSELSQACFFRHGPRDYHLSSTIEAETLTSSVQFTGDIHQPLHVENLEIGGNGIAVLFNNKTTNLHAAVSLPLLIYNLSPLTLSSGTPRSPKSSSAAIPQHSPNPGPRP